jgi:hypothetical protein
MCQRSRITYLPEGDANTKFFHLQACHRSRKNHIACLEVNDMTVVDDDAKAQVVYEHFNGILGTPPTTSYSLDFQRLGVPVTDLTGTDYCFLMEEIGELFGICRCTRRQGRMWLHQLVLSHCLVDYQTRHHGSFSRFMVSGW